MKTKREEVQEILVPLFEEEQGYIKFILDDSNKTEIEFDCDSIEQLGLEMNKETLK